jgi:hypothetical protein
VQARLIHKALGKNKKKNPAWFYRTGIRILCLLRTGPKTGFLVQFMCGTQCDLKPCPMKCRTSLGFNLFEIVCMGMWELTFWLFLHEWSWWAMATGMRGVTTTLMNLLFLVCCWVRVLVDKICVEVLNEEEWLRMEIRSVDGGFKWGGFGEDGNEAKCISLGLCVFFSSWFYKKTLG